MSLSDKFESIIAMAKLGLKIRLKDPEWEYLKDIRKFLAEWEDYEGINAITVPEYEKAIEILKSVGKGGEG